MTVLYNIAIYSYYFLIRIAALFNPKAKLWIEGRKGIFKRIASQIKTREDIAWFHAASLGEFEQGRPVMEAFRKQFPSFKICLPSFLHRDMRSGKNYKGADYIFYLPIDTPGNARNVSYIWLIRKIAVFIKYEFWFNYIRVLHQKQVPLFIISAIFRKEQHFFQWYGGWFRKMLRQILLFLCSEP